MLDVVKLRVEGNEGVGRWLEMYSRLWSQVGKLWLVGEKGNTRHQPSEHKKQALAKA